MENWTIDEKRDIGLPAYFKNNENFSEKNSSMLRFVYIKEGSGVIKLNKEILVFSAPSLLCLNELDELELLKALNLSAQAVYFNPTLLSDILQLDSIRNTEIKLSPSQYQDYFLIAPFVERETFKISLIVIGPITSKRVSYLFEAIKAELTIMENEFWPCRCRSFLFEALSLVQFMITDSKNKDNVELPVPQEEISNIILYLHTNYNRKITIEELTESFHINRTTLSEKFRKSTGLSIIEYLVRYRVKMAEIMLRDTWLPVSEILYRAGFNDSVHFTRMFKKYTGDTPSSYREKYLQKAW